MRGRERGKSARSTAHLITAACAMVAVVAACGSGGKGTPSTTPTTVPSSSTSTSTVTPVSSRLVIYLIAREHVAAAGRDVTATPTPAAALRALVAGPHGAVERGLGYTTAIPSGTTVRGVTVGRGVATVDLSHEFASGGGSQSMQERVAQVVFTVTQFPSIQHVRFRIDGKAVSTIGGEGLIVDNVDRATFTNVTPLILVESPTPGQRVRSPLHAHGTSNTYEATVNYTITDSSGAVLTEGYTTATAGTGTWGTFAFDVSFASGHPGLGHLTAYSISPKDGAHVDVTSIPIELP